MKPDVAARIANTTKEQDFARREAVFEENREPLQSQIRYVLLCEFSYDYMDILVTLLAIL